MSLFTISYATATTLTEMRIVDPNNTSRSQTISNPKYITSLTHEVVADGIANQLNLTLTHFIDPFREDSDYPEDIFGLAANTPSYLMVLISNGLQKISMRYGYAQGTQSVEESMTPWFDMIIIDVKLSYGMGFVNYNITAVSTIVSDNLQTYTYNWRTMEEVEETDEENVGNTTETATFDSTRMQTIIQKCIVDAPSETATVKGLGCPVTYQDGIIPVLPDSIFSDPDNATLIQSNIDNINFVKGCLAKCVSSAPGKVITTTDENGNQVSMHCLAVHANFTINFTDTDSGTIATVRPVTKMYVQGLNTSTLSFTKVVAYESESTDIGSSLGYLVYYGAESVRGRTDFMAQIYPHDLYTGAEVISANLEFPIIAGLYTKNNTNPVDSNGNITTQEQVAVELSISSGDKIISDEMAAMTTVASYNRVASNLIATGTITIPGVARVLTMLSMVQFYCYVSNKLDIVSGNYRILKQTDRISNGVYTTTLEVYKESSLDGIAVYGA